VSDHPWLHQLPAASLRAWPGRCTALLLDLCPRRRGVTGGRLAGPRYIAWIDAHADAALAQVVAKALALADRIGSRLGGDDEARSRHHFTLTARYERMLWDAAYRLEQWPLAESNSKAP
jgi:hypothetical protein